MTSDSTCSLISSGTPLPDTESDSSGWIQFEIAVLSDDWVHFNGVEVAIDKSVAALADRLAAPASGSVLVSIALSSDEAVQRLNRDYRGQDKPTNVLSFASPPIPGGAADRQALAPQEIGDVVLAYETIVCEARDGGVPVLNHVCHLAIHGILHLLGYDHQNDVEAREMEHLEIDILAKLGIDNPYQDANRGD